MKYLIIPFLFIMTACSDGITKTEAQSAGATTADTTSGTTLGTTSTDEPSADEIQWFSGDVGQAFLQAKEEGKPIFLYWGAVWCPPCQEIKQTVFKSRRFISLTESFIPIYLDGDTARAQAAGEQFGVKGYPTMIVFNSLGEEITRIPGGIDISKYNDILAVSLNSIKPTSQLVEMVQAGSTTLTNADFQQLAYYSWGQDQQALPEKYSPEIFLEMSNASKEPLASARLYMQYLRAVASSTEAESRPVLVTEAMARVTEILQNDALTLASWEYFAYYTQEVLSVVVDVESDPEGAAMFADRWKTTMIRLSDSPSLSTAEQLAGFLPAIHFYYLEDETREISPEFKTQILAAVRKADRATRNSFARQSVVSQINYVLQSAHLVSEAKAILLAELKKSTAPYYFMSSLSSIAENDGDDETALDWRRKAYESSQGAATRFQWGANYVRTLIRLTPEDDKLIVTTAMKLLLDIDSEEDTFSGRNFRVLRSMTKSLRQWAEENAVADNNIEKENTNSTGLIGSYNKFIETRCKAQESGTTALENCATLI
ncbi:thioredoxin family protein [Pseudomonadales bacterium]|nr:thioredoxin family protein [Pseudomonadales bacterium]